jgi:hypothetical protein
LGVSAIASHGRVYIAGASMVAQLALLALAAATPALGHKSKPASAFTVIFQCADHANLCRLDTSTRRVSRLTRDGIPEGARGAYSGPSLAAKTSTLAFVYKRQAYIAPLWQISRAGPLSDDRYVDFVVFGAFNRILVGNAGRACAPPGQPCVAARELKTVTPSGALIAAIGPIAASASWLRQRIVFIPSDKLEFQELDVIDTDGGRRTKLYRSQQDLADPAGSPDGTKVAVTIKLGVNDRSQIGIFHVPTRTMSVLTWGSSDSHPAWCADGKTIVFVRRGALWAKSIAPLAVGQSLRVRGSEPTCR